MKLRYKLSYIALGGLLMLIGILASSVFMPNLFAQRDRFGDIECTKLTIVGDKGIPLIELNSNHRRGSITVHHVNENYGYVSIGVDGWLRSQGGFISVVGRNGENAMLGISDYGGFASMSTGKAFSGKPLAEIGIQKLSNGMLQGVFNQHTTQQKATK